MRTYTRVYLHNETCTDLTGETVGTQGIRLNETFYLTARLNCRELTSGEIDRINSYVLLKSPVLGTFRMAVAPELTQRRFCASNVINSGAWLEIQSIGGIREHAHFRLVYDKYSVIAYVPQ